jgi:signal transduction histidine kinase
MVRVPPQSGISGVSPERRQADPGAEQRMEAVGKLVGSIAHDFNNVLTLIKSYGHLAQLDVDNPDGVTESLERISSATDRGVVLTRLLMMLTPQTHDEVGQVDVNDVILGLQGLLPRLFDPRIKVHLNLGAGLPPLYGRSNVFGQYLLDMALNAGRWATPQSDALVETRVDRGRDGERRITVSLRLTRCLVEEDDRRATFLPILTEYLRGEEEAEIVVQHDSEEELRYLLVMPAILHS